MLVKEHTCEVKQLLTVSGAAIGAVLSNRLLWGFNVAVARLLEELRQSLDCKETLVHSAALLE